MSWKREHGRESKGVFSFILKRWKKIFIELTFHLSLEIRVGVWQTERWSLSLVKRRDRVVGARSTEADMPEGWAEAMALEEGEGAAMGGGTVVLSQYLMTCWTEGMRWVG